MTNGYPGADPEPPRRHLGVFVGCSIDSDGSIPTRTCPTSYSQTEFAHRSDHSNVDSTSPTSM